jgi:hypothetical protein
MLFNLYYLNFAKAYEIKMMLSNVVKTGETIETNQQDESNAELNAKMGFTFLKLFSGEVGSGIKSGSSDSEKVLENFKVTMTKSLVLNEVMEKCKTITDFNNEIAEGSLVRIDNVSLGLENETELRTVKMFSNGMFKGITIPEAGGLDINNVFNSMFKDYAYKIKGSVNDGKSEILIKIPLRFESEFENQYSIDDLFIGKVSIIGIYKGIIDSGKLKNSFEFFQEKGQGRVETDETEIHSSQYQSTGEKTTNDTECEGKMHYIDLLAIVQDIQPNENEKEIKTKRGKCQK